MAEIPSNQHITYQLQYRKCGKASCSTCRKGQGHGPYWYAYWRVGTRLRSGYIGKIHPSMRKSAPPLVDKRGQPAKVLTEEYAATIVSAARL